MGSPHDGVYASWVGWTEDNLSVGDRCRVLVDEGAHSHVRWVTGKRTGNIEIVASDNLVHDAARARFDDDEFGLDVAPPRRVAVACAQIIERGGHEALLAALEQQGLLDEATSIVSEAVESAISSLRSDPAWSEVSSEIGEAGGAIMAMAVRRACTKALEEAEHVRS